MARAAAPASGAPAMSCRRRASPGQFECPHPTLPRKRGRVGWGWAADFVYDPVLRYMKAYGLTHEQLAMVSVVQREWAAKNPRHLQDADHRVRRMRGTAPAQIPGARSATASAACSPRWPRSSCRMRDLSD